MIFNPSLFTVSLLLFSTSFSGALDTLPSTKPYGICKKIDAQASEHSQWCKKGPLRPVPSLKRNAKFGRQTIFSGPLGIQRGWCGKVLEGSANSVPVAISTKYIPSNGRSPDSPYCGACICVQVVGTDETSNPHPTPEARKYFGRVFKGKVLDSCVECDDDHIDVLSDRPYTYAPTNKDNPKAAHYNSLPGPRAIPSRIAYSVGIWKVQWNFASCSTNCEAFFR